MSTSSHMQVLPPPTSMELPGASPNISPTQQLQQLPTAVQLHILSLLPPNERALSARFVCRDAWAAFVTDDHLTASLSQPLPLHAARWAEAVGQQHVWQLPFQHKVQLLCTAAASGSEVNLGVAMAVLQPSIFSELLQSGGCAVYPDPGVAAVTEGHAHLLAWLKSRCPGLLRPDSVLQAAARHRQLQGLQTAWAELTAAVSSGGHPSMDQRVLDAAAESTTPDAVAKVEWVLAAGHGSCGLQESTAAAAACSGDPGRLRWLHAQGCPMAGQDVLGCALQHTDLATVQWLVGEAGGELPPEGSRHEDWLPLLEASARSPHEGVSKLGWLVEKGAPALDAHRGTVCRLALASARAGRVEVLRHLMSAYGHRALLDGREAFGLGGLEAGEVGARAAALAAAKLLVPEAATGGCIPVLEYLRQTGVAIRTSAYAAAAAGGNVATVRWLAQTAGVHLTHWEWGTLCEMIGDWPRGCASHSRGLLEAVQILEGDVFCGWLNHNGKAEVLSAAVERGELSLVQYLQQQLQLPAHRLHLPDKHVSAVAIAGCEGMLEWLVDRRICWGPLGATQTFPFAPPYLIAAKNADRCTLTALRRLGAPWGAEDVVAQAVYRGCVIPAVRWLVEQGAPVGTENEVTLVVALRVHQRGLGDGEAAWLRGLVAAAEQGW